MKKWEITIIELYTEGKIIYKVTRKLPEYATSETKIYANKTEALEQVTNWSQ